MKKVYEVGPVRRLALGFCPRTRAGAFCLQSLEQCFYCLNFAFCTSCKKCTSCSRDVRHIPDFAAMVRGGIYGNHEMLALAAQLGWPGVYFGAGKHAKEIPSGRQNWEALYSSFNPPEQHAACWALCDLLKPAHQDNPKRRKRG